jgi:hypothetical protein
MRSGIESGESKGTLEKSKHPREAVRPADLIDKLSIDERTTLIIRSSTGQNSYADDDESRDTPQEGGFVEQW